jgi:hypothetical protein
MTRFRKLLLLVLVLIAMPARAEELGYESYLLKLFPKSSLYLPLQPSQDRLYLRTSFSKDIAKVEVLVDQKALVKPLGNAQTSSMPIELMQGYGKAFTEVHAFPKSAFVGAKDSITFALYFDDGKTRQIEISGKKLRRITEKLHATR